MRNTANDVTWIGNRKDFKAKEDSLLVKTTEGKKINKLNCLTIRFFGKITNNSTLVSFGTGGIN